MTFSSISFIYLYLPLAIIYIPADACPSPGGLPDAALLVLLSAGKCSGGTDPWRRTACWISCC